MGAVQSEARRGCLEGARFPDPGVVDSSELWCWKYNLPPLQAASTLNRIAHLQPKLFLEKMCKLHTVVDAFLSSQARENLDLNRAIPKDTRS